MPKGIGRSTVAFFSLVFLSCRLASAQPGFGQSLPEAKPLTADQRIQIEAWRRQYPYVSLAERLAYEDAHRNDPAPKLSSGAERDLSSKEQGGESIRAESLKMLHSDQVERFIANQGLGFRRMIAPSPEHLQPGAPPPMIAFDRVPPLSEAETALVPTPLLHGEQSPSSDANPNMLKLLPTRSEVGNFHWGSLHWFLGVYNFGHVKSREQVVGFIPHTFSEPPKMSVDSWRLPKFAGPDAEPPQDPTRWKIARLELVSLLKYDEPRVYESKHLPRMDELRDAPTRALTKFESESLAKLREGIETPTSSTTNRILMLGSIRANKTCLQCHEVPRGTLLGAFSYELQRDPPLPTPPAAAPVQ